MFILNVNVAKAQSSASTIQLYTSMPLAKAEQLSRQFEALHPDFSIQIYRAGTSRISDKIKLNALLNAPSADVVLIADEINMEELKVKGLLQPYPEASVGTLPPGSYDKAMSYFGTKLMSTVLIFDPAKTSRPTTWKELALPKSGPVALANPLTSGSALANLWYIVDLLGWDYYKSLSKNNAQVLRKNSQILTAVLNGTAAYGWALDYVAVAAKNSGKSIDFVYPEEGVVLTSQPIAIAAGAQNIQGAKAFINFILSSEGQRITRDQGYRPLLRELGLPQGYPDNIHTFKARPIDAQNTLLQMDALRTTFEVIFSFYENGS